MIRFAIASIIAMAAVGAFAEAANAGTGGASFTDAELLDAAYNGPRVYSGAYSEPATGASLYYVSENGIERCSDDVAEARGWAAAVNAASNVQRTAGAERQTARFYEFRYDGATSILMRVHKCAYAEPTHAAAALQSGPWGTYNGSMQHKAVRDFAEYEWFIRNEPWGARSLMAFDRASSGGFEEARLYFAAHTGQTIDELGVACDEISFVEQRVRIDRATGQVTMTFSTLRTVQGICEPALGG